MTVRPAVTPDTATPAESATIRIALRNMWDENERLSRGLSDLSQRIEANILKLCERFGFDLPLFHAWCRATTRH